MIFLSELSPIVLLLVSSPLSCFCCLKKLNISPKPSILALLWQLSAILPAFIHLWYGIFCIMLRHLTRVFSQTERVESHKRFCLPRDQSNKMSDWSTFSLPYSFANQHEILRYRSIAGNVEPCAGTGAKYASFALSSPYFMSPVSISNPASKTWDDESRIRIVKATQYLFLSYLHSFQFALEE